MGIESFSSNLWEERGKIEQGAFAAAVMRGDLTPDQALSRQKENTGHVLHKKSVDEGGWTIRTKVGDRNFDNLAAVAEWAGETGGLVYDYDENGKELLIAGEPVDSILERKAIYVAGDERRQS